MAKLHLTLGDKGGIGKSFIASLMAQYYRENMPGVQVDCLDMDPKNKTLSRYGDLNVTLIDVQTDGDIDKKKFDIFVNRVLDAPDDGVVIADVGGNIYISLTDYLRVNEILELLMENGVEVTLNIPIVGGGDLFPTLKTLDELMVSTPPTVKASIWINQKNGRVEHEGKCFEESERHDDYKKRINTVCYIPLWRPDMQVDVAKMLEIPLTFEAAMLSDAFNLIGKQRLKMAKRYLYAAVERSGVCL